MAAEGLTAGSGSKHLQTDRQFTRTSQHNFSQQDDDQVMKPLDSS